MGKFVAKDTKVKTESAFGSDLPQDIIFPDQLNRYFRDQIQSLMLENGGLRRSLEETQDELTETREKLRRASQTVPAGRVAEAAEYKIAQLSKRLREQNAEMERLRTQAKEADAKLRKAVEREEEAEPPQESELAEKNRQIKALGDKLQMANAKMCDFRNQYQTLKQEMKIAQRVIESEVGEKCSLQDLAKENGTWRGRAQQILALQSKVQQLQDQLNNTTATDNPASVVLRQMEKDRRASYEETSKQLNQKTIQVEDMKKRLDAAKARNKVLESEVVQAKAKLSAMAEKSAKDEQMMTNLTNQINAFEDRGKAQMQCFSKVQVNMTKLQEELELERKKNEQLQRALGDRESRIRRMEEQIGGLRENLKRGVREEANPTADKSTEPLTPERGNDAERLRLLELLSVVNARLEASRAEQNEAETQLRRERSKNAKLETKVARLQLEKVGAFKTGRGSYSSVKTMDNGSDDADVLAQQHIEYLEEECLALRTRIETLQMEKDADLRAFAAMQDDGDWRPRKNMSSPKLLERRFRVGRRSPSKTLSSCQSSEDFKSTGSRSPF